MPRISFLSPTVGALLVAIGASVSLVGCSSSSQSVEVRVSQPEVFTRQRLVNRVEADRVLCEIYNGFKQG